MKKNKFLLLFLLLFMALMSRVYADEDRTCNAVSLNELTTLASNVKITYVEDKEKTTVFDGSSGTNIESYEDVLYIKIYNLTSRLYITYDMAGKDIISNADQNEVITLDKVKDGAVTIRQAPMREMITYTFKIASDAYGCGNKTLRTVKLTLPRFNYYSKQTICADIPDYYLCKKFVTFDGDNNAEFYEKVKEYKAKLAEQKEKENENDGNIISDTISNVSKYKYVVVGAIVAAGVVITVITLRRKRSDK